MIPGGDIVTLFMPSQCVVNIQIGTQFQVHKYVE